jgi:SHS2 domain-containing protein
MKKFEFLDHTADIGIRIFGRSSGELFENAGLALFHIITDPAKVRDKEQRSFNLQRDCIEELLVEWLSNLLYLHDIEAVLFSRFHIKIIDATSLQAEAWGEIFSEKNHYIKTEVKAITYHNLRVTRRDDGIWTATVILDL